MLRRRMCVALLAAIPLSAVLAFGQEAADQGSAPAAAPLPDRMPASSRGTVGYAIRATLDADGHTIHGSETVRWRNDTSAPTAELWWHVYNNAWSSRGSVWLQESRLFGEERLPRQWGGTEISGVRGAGGGDLPWEWVVQAGAPEDRTVMRVDLPAAVPPGGEVTVVIDFVADLPPAFRRSGYGSDGYVHAVQWFPKLGVFEEDAGAAVWNCPPYHFLTEFYADYGDWQVELTVPEAYRGKLAASGSVQGEPAAAGEGLVTYRFEARDLHDFAWTGDPDFVVVRRRFRAAEWRDEAEEARVSAALGRPVEDLRPAETEIILYLQPEHREYEERYIEATAKALYYFGLWYGSYPYETISVIDPAHDARRTGGMEYPRLFTGGVGKGSAARSLSPEGVTVHEFGHQFWYGLVGNDEFQHAWLDEGFNTFSTNRVLQHGWPAPLSTWSLLGREHYGRAPVRRAVPPAGDFRDLLALQSVRLPALPALGGGDAPWKGRNLVLRRRTSLEDWAAELPGATYLPEVAGDPVFGQRGTFSNDVSDPLARPTFELLENSMRGVNAYRRPALTLETMARLMGEVRFTRLMRAYHERWRFGHPRPADFFEEVKEHAAGAVVGVDSATAIAVAWTEFWQQAYHGNQALDFAVHRIANLPEVADSAALAGGDDADLSWVVVEVRRKGDFRVPVEIRITWDDGEVTDEVWDGQDWWWRFELRRSVRKAVSVEVDPNRKLLLDRDWLNNTRRAAPATERAERLGLRALLWAQQLLQHYGGVG
ncbi:MAG TPA: M1 family metallopeptidase [Planctomycetota bacterium]